jgi:DNA-binding NtrC family response regulator
MNSFPHNEPKTILLVEDDQNILRMLDNLLLLSGYDSISAINGKEALDKIANYPKPIDLLITDLVMPIMGGEKLAYELTQIYPDLKIVMMSGSFYKPKEIEKYLGRSIIILRKPFSILDFKEIIKNLIG